MFQAERLNKRDWMVVAIASVLMALVSSVWVYWILH